MSYPIHLFNLSSAHHHYRIYLLLPLFESTSQSLPSREWIGRYSPTDRLHPFLYPVFVGRGRQLSKSHDLVLRVCISRYKVSIISPFRGYWPRQTLSFWMRLTISWILRECERKLDVERELWIDEGRVILAGSRVSLLESGRVSTEIASWLMSSVFISAIALSSE
jgi:hypothetical protein